MDITYKTQIGDIVQDMTQTEIAEYKLILDDIAVRKNAEAQAESNKAIALAKLEKLGLSMDDLKAIGL